jgi:hypothetical protein
MSRTDGQRFLVGTAGGLYEIGPRQRCHLEGHDITAVAGNGGETWALVDGQVLWRARNGGRWQEAGALADDRGICLAMTPSGTLIGTAGAHLLRLNGGEIEPIESFENVEGRRTWTTPWGAPPDTRSISSGANGTLYVNVHVGGVARSRDGGRSWRPTLDIDADPHQVLAHPRRPNVVFAAAAAGFGISEDGGDSWRFETAGLHAHYLRAVAVAGETVLVSASTGPGGRRAAIYARTFGDSAPFRRCRHGLPEWFDGNIDTGCLAAAGATALLGSDDGQVFRSRDTGAHWEIVAAQLPEVRCVHIVA